MRLELDSMSVADVEPHRPFGQRVARCWPRRSVPVRHEGQCHGDLLL